MKFKSLVLPCLLFIFVCCKEAKTKKSIPTNDSPTFDINRPVDSLTLVGKPSMNADRIKTLNAQALSIIDFRIKQKPESVAAIEVGKWEFDGAFESGLSKMEEYKGVWYDFDEKNNYVSGKGDIVIDRGKYHFNLDSKILLIVSENEYKKPCEYKVMMMDGAMVIIGEETYEDNAFQAKLNNIK